MSTSPTRQRGVGRKPPRLQCLPALNVLIARKTSVSRAEHKRLCDLSCVLIAEQAGAFVGALIAAARETVMPVSEEAYRKLMERTCQLLPGRPADVQAQEGNR